MSDLDLSILFPNTEFENIRDILVFAYNYLEKNDLWKWFMRLQFHHDNEQKYQLACITNIEIVTKSDKLTKFKKNLYAHCLNDTLLLHTILFLQENVHKGYVIEDFPLLVKESDAIINPIHIK
jgi:hypothetical protein